MHIASTSHIASKAKLQERKSDDHELKDFLDDYFHLHKDEASSSLQADVHLIRYRLLESWMSAGLALSSIDVVRPVLERMGALNLTSSSHLRMLIPKIEEREHRKVHDERHGQACSIIYDGTCRNGDCICVIFRWVSEDFHINQRLACLKTAEEALDGTDLGHFLVSLLFAQYQVKPKEVIGCIRDSCGTNAKAERTIAHLFPNMFSVLCVSHTLSHCGEHVQLPILDEFMMHWIGLVKHHPGAKREWKALVGGKMVAFSKIRWCSRHENANELAKHFHQLRPFLQVLNEKEIGEKHREALNKITQDNIVQLELELAMMLDLECIITTCYSLEGDGLCHLQAREKLQSLLNRLDEMGCRCDTLPNLSKCIKKHTVLKRGTKVLELFVEGVNQPTWFSGEVTGPPHGGKVTVLYADATSIEQDVDEARQWIDVTQDPDWTRLSAAAHDGLKYLKDRLTGNCQANYDCSQVYEFLRVVQVFNPAWASSSLHEDTMDALRIIPCLHSLLDKMRSERADYLAACISVVIDPGDGFTDAILTWWRNNGDKFPAWREAARLVFAFNCSSAAAERVFSRLARMFSTDQLSSLMDYVCTSVMLSYNQRLTG